MEVDMGRIWVGGAASAQVGFSSMKSSAMQCNASPNAGTMLAGGTSSNAL